MDIHFTSLRNLLNIICENAVRCVLKLNYPKIFPQYASCICSANATIKNIFNPAESAMNRRLRKVLGNAHALFTYPNPKQEKTHACHFF